MKTDENESELKKVIKDLAERLGIAIKEEDKVAMMSLQEEIKAHLSSDKMSAYNDALNAYLSTIEGCLKLQKLWE